MNQTKEVFEKGGEVVVCRYIYYTIDLFFEYRLKLSFKLLELKINILASVSFQWSVYYTSPQSFMIKFSYSLAQQLWGHYVESQNFSTTKCNLQKW